jgi:ergothioneine biosynthesis protein EgtB
VQLGLQHEQQHQELMFTDLKHAFFQNPLRPAYRLVESSSPRQEPVALEWIDGRAGVHFLGHDAPGFAFDNEGPRHRVYLQPYQLASRLVNNRDYLEFIEDGGYSRPELWLSDGWATCRAAGWTAPLYWERADGDWTTFTLNGMQPLEGNDPVGHLSFYEADAFARWAGARLPTEAEWEVLAADLPVVGNFLENDQLRPTGHGAAAGGKLAQMFGDVWEWTGSPYVAYPGYRPVEGALGEYNGKFMCNQFVLRGGSCVTPRSHIRPTYRNFFPPEARWQFAGLRLARDS